MKHIPKNGVKAWQYYNAPNVVGVHFEPKINGQHCRIFSEERAKELLSIEKTLNQLKPFIKANVKGFNQ